MSQINPRGRMKCKCCNHEKAAEIDLGLSRGVPIRVLGQRYGVGTDSLTEAGHASTNGAGRCRHVSTLS